MKVLFTIIIGVALGWLNAQWDVEGQLALEQHQLEITRSTDLYRTSLPTTELPVKFPSRLGLSR